MNDEDALLLWVGAFRYYLGRRTYAVGMFCDLLRQAWSRLPERTRHIISSELASAFKSDDEFRGKAQNSYLPLGDDCDRREWEKVRAHVTKMACCDDDPVEGKEL